ncbi:hypothetical protein PVAND_003150 [Polypedilum vanderplanki]|uniref:Uncharacterized protein n=1 Tax=Polypedilum vanderplanki TaxID=319348 RepID=A0A9J6BU89_POLVA|nr:hypothetical protein PVAND_003150 [Polypedilum vanderplanki]
MSSQDFTTALTEHLQETSDDEYLSAVSSFESIPPGRSSTPYEFVQQSEQHQSHDFHDDSTVISESPQPRRSLRLLEHNQASQSGNNIRCRCSLCRHGITPLNPTPRKRKSRSRSRPIVDETPKTSKPTKRKMLKPLSPIHKAKRFHSSSKPRSI